MRGEIAARGHARFQRRQSGRLLERIAGVTSHHSLSSRNRASAMRETRTCPSCGGLKEPPKSPMRMPGACGGSLGIMQKGLSRPHLSGAMHAIFE